MPEPLRPWVAWALHGEQEARCPLLASTDRRECLWPAQLELALGATGGTTRQQWSVYRDGWVPLPGDSNHWPQEVKVDGQTAIVTELEGLPRVRLTNGRHTVEASFRWDALPDALTIPPATALI